MKKHRTRKTPSGIIAITEVYTSDPPVSWLCDMSKLDQVKHKKLIDALTEAVNDHEHGAGEMAYDAGFQGDAGDIAVADPPCYMTDQVMLYAD